MPSNTLPKTILIKGDADACHAVEGEATSQITPGHLMRYDGATNKLRVSNVAADTAAIQRMFALENDVVGQIPNVGQSIDQVYAVGDRVYGLIVEPGDRLYALVNAGAPAIVFGDLLESALDGSLVKRGTGTPIAMALEDVNNSGGSSEARIKVEIV